MERYRYKVKDISYAKEETNELKKQGRVIVFTNGCFDILHIGHARYLWSARELGDFLIVAVNSDRSVRSIKGPERPVNRENERAEMLAALECVDMVIIFDEENPLKVIEDLVPDVLVKGGDWTEDQIIGSDVVKKSGGKVIRIPFIDGSSTTGIINRILNPDR